MRCIGTQASGHGAWSRMSLVWRPGTGNERVICTDIGRKHAVKIQQIVAPICASMPLHIERSVKSNRTIGWVPQLVSFEIEHWVMRSIQNDIVDEINTSQRDLHAHTDSHRLAT